MGFYTDVQAGEAFQPSALLENDIRHFFNALNGFQAPAATGKAESTRLKIYNMSSTEILVEQCAVAFDEKGEVIDGALPARQYRDGDKYWGIATQDISPNAFATCVVSGAVFVKITGEGDFAYPTTDGKIVAGATGAPIIYRTADTAVINLGGGSAAVDEYNGPLKLKPVSLTQVMIVNGARPEDTVYAGRSDVPGFEEIPQLTLNVTADVRHCIYLYFDYSKEKKAYSVHLGTEVPKGSSFMHT